MSSPSPVATPPSGAASAAAKSTSKPSSPAAVSESASSPPPAAAAAAAAAATSKLTVENREALERERRNQPQLGTGNIEVDVYDDESAIGMGSVVTDTSSLRESIMAYKYENNRRYHAFQDGAYYSPNDEIQQRAEDLMHDMFTIIMNDNYTMVEIPDTVQKVLDLGTGTGMWAIDFADRYPAAEVIGVDLSPIQPHFVPPNCKFEVDDITREWTYPHSSFDLVHVRALTGCVPDWVQLYRQAYSVLKVGGFIEHVELFGLSQSDDGSVLPGSPLLRWVDEFRRIGSAMGKPFFFGDEMEANMQKVGFTTTKTKIKVPIGPWAKDKDMKAWGEWNRQFLLTGLEGFAMRGLTELLHYTYEEAQIFISEVRAHILDPKVHAYIDMIACVGVKNA